jgi:hypothetical protein
MPTRSKRDEGRFKARAREHKKGGAIARFMATAPASINACLESVTGCAPPNTQFLPGELACIAANQIKILASQLSLANTLLRDTAPLAVGDYERNEAAIRAIRAIGEKYAAE